MATNPTPANNPLHQLLPKSAAIPVAEESLTQGPGQNELLAQDCCAGGRVRLYRNYHLASGCGARQPNTACCTATCPTATAAPSSRHCSSRIFPTNSPKAAAPCWCLPTRCTKYACAWPHRACPKAARPGFELMENQKFGTSQFLEQVNYQRSLEGELARSVQTLGSVQSARVHLAIPKATVFVKGAAKTQRLGGADPASRAHAGSRPGQCHRAPDFQQRSQHACGQCDRGRPDGHPAELHSRGGGDLWMRPSSNIYIKSNRTTSSASKTS